LKEVNSAARIAQLEDKLESLASLLRPADQDSGSIDLREASREQGQTDDGRRQPRAAETATPLLTTASPDVVRTRNGETANGWETAGQPSINDAEIAVRIFRDTMLPSLAFFHLPASMTVEHLREQKPIFFQAIITVTSSTAEQGLARGLELKRRLAHDLLVENRSELDLLLGLLTFITWSFDQFLTKTASFSRFMQLAMSIVFDLRLNQPIAQGTKKVSLFASRDNAGTIPSGPLEKERAVLGCFFLSAMYASPESDGPVEGLPLTRTEYQHTILGRLM
jgi:hypothetical protein